MDSIGTFATWQAEGGTGSGGLDGMGLFLVQGRYYKCKNVTKLFFWVASLNTV